MTRKVRRASLTARERELLEGARVARLGTVRPDGSPHVVPVTFAGPGQGPGPIVTAVDHKPKETTHLQRLRNIEAHPAVSLLVDHYEDDWTALWWLRVDATARVVRDEPHRTALTAALVSKYAQYAARPPTGPVIVMSVDAVISWNLGQEATSGSDTPGGA